MNKRYCKYWLTFVFLILFGLVSYACDLCLLPDYGTTYQRTFVRLGYSFSQNKGYNRLLEVPTIISTNGPRVGVAAHGGGANADAEYYNSFGDYERFMSVNLGFNYTIGQRYNLFVNIPYEFNSHYIEYVLYVDGDLDSEINRKSGLGDINLGAQRVFHLPKENGKQTLKLGVGITLPTGSYEVSDLLTENIHLEPGRTIYAGDFTAIYNWEQKNSWGFNVLTNLYKPFNKKTFASGASLNYFFGNRYSLDANLYKIINGDLKKTVIIGLKNEVLDQELVNTFIINGTGHYLMHGVLGAMVSTDKMLAYVDFNIPITQTLNGLQLKNALKFNVSLMYYLNNKRG